MFRALRQRRLLLPVCRLLLVALLWQSGMVAAHACDNLSAVAHGSGMPVAGCAHMDKAVAMDALCAQHSHPADSHDALAFDLHVPRVLPSAALTTTPAYSPAGVTDAVPRLVRGNAPPLRTLYCTLLI